MLGKTGTTTRTGIVMQVVQCGLAGGIEESKYLMAILRRAWWQMCPRSPHSGVSSRRIAVFSGLCFPDPLPTLHESRKNDRVGRNHPNGTING
jgi:hypothetical protein